MPLDADMAALAIAADKVTWTFAGNTVQMTECEPTTPLRRTLQSDGFEDFDSSSSASGSWGPPKPAPAPAPEPPHTHTPPPPPPKHSDTLAIGFIVVCVSVLGLITVFMLCHLRIIIITFRTMN
eukprot:COSAG01_NODE_1683_length_9497_cov_33.408172_3_plen_124_part_00